MTYISDILLGRITKVNGYDGTVAVKLEKDFTEDIPDMESVFLEIEGRPVPFFISYSEYSGADILKLKFVGYDSIEKIREFTGCRIFLSVFRPIENLSEDNKSFIGYKIFLKDNILLGSVTEVIQNPGQWLLKVLSTDNKDILIPFHEHFIVSIDKTGKSIVMNLPEGLTEIN